MRVRVPGGEVEARIEGRGPAVLLLHAFPFSSAMWDAQAEAWSTSITVVRFDARGFGASPPGDGLLTMERIADDAAAVLEHAGVPRAVVLGISMGGYAAFALVRRHPRLLRALVLADTRAGADSPETRRSRSLQAEKVRQSGTASLAESMVPRLVGRTSQAERPAVVAAVRDAILAAPPRGVVDALAGLAARADSTPTLREVRVPTLVVVGAEDEITPPAEAEALTRGIAGARQVTIPRTGHLPSLEDPAAFDAAVRPFLQQNG